MQTFMPYADYAKSAKVLDNKRLGKQRVETFQILLQLCGLDKEGNPREGKWNHPAMAMWAGHEIALFDYQTAVCNEWTGRGFKDTCLKKSERTLETCWTDDWMTTDPEWVGKESVHLSHKSNLVLKDPEFYGPVLDTEAGIEYEWPKTCMDLKWRMRDNYMRMVSR